MISVGKGFVTWNALRDLSSCDEPGTWGFMIYKKLTRKQTNVGKAMREPMVLVASVSSL